MSIEAFYDQLGIFRRGSICGVLRTVVALRTAHPLGPPGYFALRYDLKGRFNGSYSARPGVL